MPHARGRRRGRDLVASARPRVYRLSRRSASSDRPSRGDLPGHFRSRPRVTACVVIRVVRRRRIGPYGASLSGAFPVASARHRARRPPRRSASSDRVLTGEFSGAFPVASARHSVCRLPVVQRRLIGPSRGEFPGAFLVAPRVTACGVVRVVQCRLIAPSWDEFPGAFNGHKRSVFCGCGASSIAVSSCERIDETRCRARVDELSRSRRPRGRTRQDFEHVIDELSCLSSSERGSTFHALEHDRRTVVLLSSERIDERHDIEFVIDELSCARRPRGSTRHWRATCPTGSAPRRRD